MAIITKSIGATGRDYSTITAWEADLDNGAVYSAGDDAVGEMYNDAVFDEGPTINGGATIGLNSVKLSVASGQRHDGTAGTGARIVTSTNNLVFFINTPSGFDNKYTFEWFEYDKNNKTGQGFDGNSQSFGNVAILKNLIIHDANGGNSFRGLIRGTSRDIRVQNCFVYNNTRNTTSIVRGIELDSDRTSGGCQNNTVFNIQNTSVTGGATGIMILTDSANGNIENNISIDTNVSGTGTIKDFDFPGTAMNSNNNLSSDLTSNDGGGTGHLESKLSSNQFVSTVNGSEDLHLKTGADAIDAGVDLGITPTDIEIDINGRNRDSSGDVWDIGAHELVVAGGQSIVPHIVASFREIHK